MKKACDSYNKTLCGINIKHYIRKERRENKKNCPDGEIITFHFRGYGGYYSGKVIINTLTDDCTDEDAVKQLVSKYGNKGYFWATVDEF